MSNSTGASTGTTEGEGTPQGTPTAGGEGTPQGTPTPDADTTDWKAEARKWETRSKENKTALDDLTGKFSKLESKNGELAEKVTDYESKAERAEREKTEQADRDALLDKVSKATGIPAAALRGADEAALTAHAETLKELMPSAPVIEGQGKSPDKQAGDPNIEAVNKLFGKN